MRNPHLTPEAGGPNSNRPKRLKTRGQKMAGGIKKKLNGSSISGYNFFFRPMAGRGPALLSCLHPTGPGLPIT